MAENGVLFENAISQSSYTLSSLSSLLISTYLTPRWPKDFGNESIGSESKIPENMTTIVEYLKNKNYQTYAVTSAPFTHKIFNMDQGFDIYIDKTYQKTNNEEIFRIGSKFLNKTGKFFMWFHLPNPHQGYNPPNNFSGIYSSEFDSNISSNHTLREFHKMNLSKEDIKYIRTRYDEELKYADFSIGKFLRKLKNKGLYKNSLIFLTADHGENLMNNGFIGHSINLYEEVIHVPFIIKFPRNKYKESKIQEVVGHIDIFPTIVNMTKGNLNNLEGVNLKEIISNKNFKRGGLLSKLYSSAAFRTIGWKLIGSYSTVGNHKYIEFGNTGDIKWELYNLSKDPQENKDLIKKEKIQRSKLDKAKQKIITLLGTEIN